MHVEITRIAEDDLDDAAAAIASGDVFRCYGVDLHSARELLARSMRDTVVGRIDGHVVGVAIYWTDGRTPVPAYLRLLAVRAGSRGKRIGTALLRFVEEQVFARGPNLFLCCSDRNERARRFYEREGYELVGPLPNLVRPGITELLYRKTLGPIDGYAPHR